MVAVTATQSGPWPSRRQWPELVLPKQAEELGITSACKAPGERGHVDVTSEPLPGAEAVAGQFFEPLERAKKAQIAAAAWDTQGGPRSLNEIYAQRNAEATKMRAGREVPDGSVPTMPQEVSMGAMRRAADARTRADVRWLVLCAGVGGFSSAIHAEPGHSVSAAVELSEALAGVYSANFPHEVLVHDICDTGKLVRELRKLGPFEAAQASPPCQPFSPSGTGLEDGRAWVSMACAVTMIELQVPTIVFENVPRFLKSNTWQVVRRLLEDAGYTVGTATLDAYDCGCPQRRRRVFVTAVRSQDPAAT